MTPAEAPVGTIVSMGNTRDGLTARKTMGGKWHYTHYPHRTVGFDDIHKGSTLVFVPGFDLPATVLVQHLRALPWGQDEDINGGDLVDLVGRLLTLEDPVPQGGN